MSVSQWIYLHLCHSKQNIIKFEEVFLKAGAGFGPVLYYKHLLGVLCILGGCRRGVCYRCLAVGVGESSGWGSPAWGARNLEVRFSTAPILPHGLEKVSCPLFASFPSFVK